MGYVAPVKRYFHPGPYPPRLRGQLIRQGAGWFLVYDNSYGETYLIRYDPQRGGWQVDVYPGYATPPCCGG